MNMGNLTELERRLLDEGHEHTTFKQCSINKQKGKKDVFVTDNETVAVFNQDEIKDTMLKDRFNLPMSIDSLWIDHSRNILHLVEFKDMSRLNGTKKREIRLKILDTLLFLYGDYNVFPLKGLTVVFILVRTLGPRELTAYHGKSLAKKYTPAYLKYVKELLDIKVLELKPDDFNKYIENSAHFLEG